MTHDETAKTLAENIFEQAIYNFLYGDEENGKQFREHFIYAYQSHIASALAECERATWEKAAVKLDERYELFVAMPETERTDVILELDALSSWLRQQAQEMK